MFHLDFLLPWIMLALMGAFHGLNPAMGWLFAVSIGFQERRTGAVLKALGPIAAGHLLAIAAVVLPVALLRVVVPNRTVMVLGGVVMLAYAIYKIATRFRHPRWIGMRVTSRELVSWSALMAAAHGAGLMLIPAIAALSHDPAVVAMSSEELSSSMHAGHAHHMQMTVEQRHDGNALVSAILAVSLHTLSMLVVMGAIAVVVYRWLGVGILRRAWVNLDVVWTGALAIAGGVTLGLAFWSPS
ncbi:MAG: hypothetical protein KC438_13455 [Thermomicrobiales bacterium]|nr:hypothetical protein [Thermomicrobiales bacterium]MCO5221927.1 hypothetical protein [Thermomicrobiales bacterium]